MESTLELSILPQPDDSTCGPTCLHAVYHYYGLHLPLQQVIREAPSLEGGGTLGVMLGIDALRRGFEAKLVTWNLLVFDPTWFGEENVDLKERLLRQRAVKPEPRLRVAIDAYREFLELGGEIRFQDLTSAVLRRYLKQEVPVLTGLSATFLYRSAREKVVDGRLRYDDVEGTPQGHFVVLCGYDPEERSVLVADPLRPNPMGAHPRYEVGIDRLLCSILLGIVTYDANLLVIRRKESVKRGRHAHPDRG